MKKYIIKDSFGWWVSAIIDGKIFASVRRSEAKVYTQTDVDEYWSKKSGYEVVELPEDEWMRRQGSTIAPRLPGFED